MYNIIQKDVFYHVNTIEDNYIDLAFVDPPVTIGNKITLRYKENFRSASAKTKEIANNSTKVTHINMLTKYDTIYTDFYTTLYTKLRTSGSLFVLVHDTEYLYARIILDQIFGAENLLNDLIWTYDYGVVTKARWATKHCHILWYVKDINDYTFNSDKITQLSYPYSKTGLKKITNPESLKTDVWYYPFTKMGAEDLKYKNQRPLALMNRIAKVHTKPNDIVYDFFAGSGSFGLACWLQGCYVNMVEITTKGYKLMNRRFVKYEEVYFQSR